MPVHTQILYNIIFDVLHYHLTQIYSFICYLQTGFNLQNFLQSHANAEFENVKSEAEIESTQGVDTGFNQLPSHSSDMMNLEEFDLDSLGDKLKLWQTARPSSQHGKIIS